MIGRIFGSAAAIALGLLAGPIPAAEAHHSISAQYDLGKKATIKGVLTKVDWQNPHAWFHFDAKQADGTVKSWATESMAPSGLRRLGFDNQSAFVVGATYSVEVYPDRSGTATGFIRSVTFPNGKEVMFRNANIIDLDPAEVDPAAAAATPPAPAAAAATPPAPAAAAATPPAPAAAAVTPPQAAAKATPVPTPAPAPAPAQAAKSATIFDQDYFKLKNADN